MRAAPILRLAGLSLALLLTACSAFLGPGVSVSRSDGQTAPVVAESSDDQEDDLIGLDHGPGKPADAR